MTTYYKATRPDGTDFYTGTIKYEVGKRVRPSAHDGERHICGPGVLHAATVPAMTLVGGWWPCRLFEVEGKPIDGLDDLHPYKGAFKQLVVVREMLAHEALGPNGEKVAALIERLKRLTPDEARVIRGAAVDVAWDAARGAAVDVVWDAARGAAADGERGAAWDAAWDAAWGAVRGAAAARGAAWDDTARGAAADAARGAAAGAAALVAMDLIPERHFKTLYGPVGEVIKDVEILP